MHRFELLNSFFTDSYPYNKDFKRDICRYNNAFHIMTSEHGFIVQGQVYHLELPSVSFSRLITTPT